MQTWGLTDPGNIRQQNQDSYAIVPFGRDRVLMIVCDGMGGHAAGEVASALAVKTVRERWSSEEIEQVTASFCSGAAADSATPGISLR